MTESLKLSAEANADWHKEQQRVKDEQEWRINATVDEWMKDDGTVENALLEAVNEVSGDMALAIVELVKLANEPVSVYRTQRATMLGMESISLRLINQLRKQMREDVEEHLYG